MALLKEAFFEKYYNYIEKPTQSHVYNETGDFYITVSTK